MLHVLFFINNFSQNPNDDERYDGGNDTALCFSRKLNIINGEWTFKKRYELI